MTNNAHTVQPVNSAQPVPAQTGADPLLLGAGGLFLIGILVALLLRNRNAASHRESHSTHAAATPCPTCGHQRGKEEKP